MKAVCTRFEREGLLALQRGHALDEHFQDCPTCRTERARYQALEHDLALLGAYDRPAADYQARVWARIAQRRAAALPWYRRRWLLGLPAVVAAAMVLLLVRPWQPDVQHQRPSLGYAITSPPGAPPMRGREARPGDVLAIQARPGAAAVAELRVYRGPDELVLHCSAEPPCEQRGGSLQARVELRSRGDYHVLLLVGNAPLPAPAPSLARDIAAAEQAGALVERGELLVVR